MSSDQESPWLRERMQQLRERRNGLTTPFERLWDAALTQQAALETKPMRPVWRLAAVSVVVVFLASVTVFHRAAERKHRRQTEREFAAVDGVLMTYWQAPSDDLFPAGKTTELPDRDE